MIQFLTTILARLNVEAAYTSQHVLSLALQIVRDEVGEDDLVEHNNTHNLSGRTRETLRNRRKYKMGERKRWTVNDNARRSWHLVVFEQSVGRRGIT